MVHHIPRRLTNTLMLFLIVCLGGTLGFHYLEGGKSSLLDCLYMTVITMSTVGYTEVLEVTPAVRAFTICLIVFGMGVMMYVVSTVTAFVVEGTLKNVLWRRRMTKLISKLENHFVVVGAGETARYIISELAVTRRRFVVVEHDRERLDELAKDFPNAPFVEGDAHDDEVLAEAGLPRAAGVISVLPDDRDNLFVTVTARQLNPGVRIVARGVQPTARAKLMRAGADSVVSPNSIGGLRMVSEMIRPAVVSFLDLMLRDKHKTMRIEEVTLAADGELTGKTVGEADLCHRARITILALRKPGEDRWHYTPVPEDDLVDGMSLVILGDAESIELVRRLAGDPFATAEDDSGGNGEAGDTIL